MARRRSASPEISLFPFLSILVCVIGALVLVITVLTIAQGTAGDGRTQEEMQRALTFQSLTQKLKDIATEREQFTEAAGAAGKMARELRQQEALVISLRRDLAELEKPVNPEDTDAELQKRLELALRQLEAMAAEKAPLTNDIARMEAELAAQKKRIEAPPSLIVQPGGAGRAAGSILFFVEVAGTGITLHQKGKPATRITTGSLRTDDAYAQFLAGAKKVREAMILYLIREDGLPVYNLAAGLAESVYGLRTGKLPLPGSGPVDLRLFGITP